MCLSVKICRLIGSKEGQLSCTLGRRLIVRERLCCAHLKRTGLRGRWVGGKEGGGGGGNGLP